MFQLQLSDAGGDRKNENENDGSHSFGESGVYRVASDSELPNRGTTRPARRAYPSALNKARDTYKSTNVALGLCCKCPLPRSPKDKKYCPKHRKKLQEARRLSGKLRRMGIAAIIPEE